MWPPISNSMFLLFSALSLHSSCILLHTLVSSYDKLNRMLLDVCAVPFSYQYIWIWNIIMPREQLIPHVASTIDSYMKEHSVSIEVARDVRRYTHWIEDSWKDFNNEWLNPNNVYPKQLLERIVNLARTMEFMYNQEDNFHQLLQPQGYRPFVAGGVIYNPHLVSAINN